MKSAGHVAYDAFRKEVEWLTPWDKLDDVTRAAWEELANATMSKAHDAQQG